MYLTDRMDEKNINIYAGKISPEISAFMFGTKVPPTRNEIPNPGKIPSI